MTVSMSLGNNLARWVKLKMYDFTARDTDTLYMYLTGKSYKTQGAKSSNGGILTQQILNTD